MPRTTRRPLDERARARLREAQRLESDAVTEELQGQTKVKLSAPSGRDIEPDLVFTDPRVGTDG